ncbi:MAG TPA: DUF2071 domain-containing protein [Flavisolibacter sp.]
MKTSTFLTAEWNMLAMANYAVDPALLEDFVPAGAQLDAWQGTCYLSLVGFMFQNTRLKGFSVPCHTSFEEVNLRFYVRYNDSGTCKRGVVFIKEIVPRHALTLVANRIYGEKYQTMPMKHHWLKTPGRLEVAYSWKKNNRWNQVTVQAHSSPIPIKDGSEEEFFTEHFWGYTRISPFVTSQYEVQHPRWNIFRVDTYDIDVDFGAVYGDRFSFLSKQSPRSVLLAEGSPVAVKAGTRFFHKVPGTNALQGGVTAAD